MEDSVKYEAKGVEKFQVTLGGGSQAPIIGTMEVKVEELAPKQMPTSMSYQSPVMEKKTLTTAEKLQKMNDLHLEEIHEAITFKDGKLTIQLQVGHPNEADSVKGCFSTHALQAFIKLHQMYQEILPSRETALVITKLEEAWLWMKKRELDREKRGVLQTDKV